MVVLISFVLALLTGITAATQCKQKSILNYENTYCSDDCCNVSGGLTSVVGIVGISIGAIVLTFFIIIIVFCCTCGSRRRATAGHRQVTTSDQPMVSFIAQTNSTSVQGVQCVQDVSGVHGVPSPPSVPPPYGYGYPNGGYIPGIAEQPPPYSPAQAYPLPPKS